MGKIAVLFPGQGAQFVGMGKVAGSNFESAHSIFNEADSIRTGLSKCCFEGPEEELNQTINTQPCVFTVEYATFCALKEMGLNPEGIAGFSLGEITGLVASEILTLAEGFDLVNKRSQAMGNATQEFDAMMIAVLKLDNQTVENICKQFERAYPVNYNCPGQLVVSLLKSDAPAFQAAVKTAGGRGMPLKVSGGFHSPFMASAIDIFHESIKDLNYQAANIPLYGNSRALPYPDDSKEILSTIVNQINHPVAWEKTIRQMITDGFDHFIEVGPGKTLGGFMKKIDASVSTSHADDLISKYLDAKTNGKEFLLDA